MWTARVFRETNWQPIEVYELTEGFNSQAVAAAADRITKGRFIGAVQHLYAEAANPLLTRGLIESWALDAEFAARSFEFEGGGRIQAVDGALAYFLPSQLDADAQAKPTTVAWHELTTVLLALDAADTEVELTYDPGPYGELRVEQMRYRYATPEHRLETSVDWRGYLGTQSGVFDGRNTMRRRGSSFVTTIRARAGLFVGTILRRLTRAQPAPLKDWTASERRLRMFEKHRELSRVCPSLDAIGPFKGESAMVFVHGTMSCGLQGLSDLIPGPAAVPPGPVFRFEHDTFEELIANGDDLANLICTKLDVERLLLVAHSRGGLVARCAKARLRGSYAAEVRLMTFGTPHLGTPLVAMGGKLLNMLCTAGEELAGAIPHVGPLAKAYSYLFDSPELPPGIEAMAEDSQALDMLGLLDASDRVDCWGANFDIDFGQPSGFGFDAENVLLGAMKGQEHDLVVPVPSALGFGAPMVKLRCSHAHYFLQPQVHAAIDQFFINPGVAAPAGAYPAADADQLFVPPRRVVRKKPR